MIEIKQVKTQDEVNYTFVEKLMHTAFPQEERRDTVQQREYSDNNPRFCNNIILENGNSIEMCIRDRSHSSSVADSLSLS